MEAEEFSFPTISENSPSRIIDSPPLWRSSSASLSSSFQHDHEDKEEEEPTGQSLQVMNEEEGEKSRKMVEDERDDREEEKMDILWDDFNFSEELLFYGSSDSCLLSRDIVHELGCCPAFKLSKVRGRGGGGGSTRAIVSGRRRSVASLVSVLKRLFLPHNSHRSNNHKRQLL